MAGKRIKKILLISIISAVAAGLVFFLAYNIIKTETEKKAALTSEVFRPEKINIDEISGDLEFAETIPEYKILFGGLLEKSLELTFKDLVLDLEDDIETFEASGVRSDGEEINASFTGIKLKKLTKNLNMSGDAENMIVYATDLYAASFTLEEIAEDDIYIVWKKDGQYLNPSEDGVLKIVQNNGPTNKWVKNPVVFDIIGEFIDRVAALDRLESNSIDFISEQQFFTLSLGYIPEIDINNWELKLGGLAENEYVFNYDDIIAMPQVSVYATLETISNPIGGNLIGNAIWTGVPLKHVLDKAQIKEETFKVIFYCEDGYSTAITIDEALKEDVILAYKMNGNILLPEHGYPLRAVVPGKYGMKWPKWINEIELTDEDYKGYWEIRGWSDYAGRDRPDQRFD